MTATKPLILFENLFNDHVDSIAAPEANACDWRLDTKWTGTGSDDCITPTFATSKRINCFAISGHNFSEGGQTIALSRSIDGGSTWYAVTGATFTPTTNKTMLVILNTTYNANRLKATISGGTGTWSIGVIAAGEYLSMPVWANRGFDPSPRTFKGKVGRNRNGSWINSGVLQTNEKETWDFAHITAAWIESVSATTPTWLDFERHASFPGGKPFFFAWDYGEHPLEIKYCFFPDGTKLSKPRGVKLRVPLLKLSFSVQQEDDTP